MYYGISRSIQKNSGSLLFLGVLQVVLGFIALTFVGLTTFLSVIYLGVLFFIGGLVEAFVGIQKRKDGHMASHLIFGILYAVCGLLIAMDPVGNAVFLTILMAVLFLVSGLVSLIGSVIERGPHWLWFAFVGLVSVILAVSILKTPVESSLWLIGTFVGIDMLLKGFTLMNLGFLGRKKARSAQATTA